MRDAHQGQRTGWAKQISAPVLLCGLWLSVTGAAAADVPDLNEARRLLDNGNAAQAVTLLERDLLRFAGNPDFDFLFGTALQRAGRTGEALFALERLLMVVPERTDARLMAARIHADRGSAALAREMLSPLVGIKLDAAKQKQLDEIQAVLTEKGRLPAMSVRGYVTVGVGRNTNVTGGPDQSSLIIPGKQPARLPPPALPPPVVVTQLGTAQKAADNFGLFETGVTVTKPIGERTWLTGNAVYSAGYINKRADVSDAALGLDISLSQKVGQGVFTAAMLAQNYALAQQTYRISGGYRLNWMQPAGESTRLNAYLQQLSFDFPIRENAIDSSVRSVAGFTGESSNEEGVGLLQYGAYGGTDKAKDPTKPHFSYRLYGVHLGGSLRLNSDLTFAAGRHYEAHDHSAQDALYLLMRRDRLHTTGLTVDYRISQNLHLVPQLTYTKNVSTAALYTYNRGAFLLQLRWNFDNEKN
jgi:hypothetical protein